MKKSALLLALLCAGLAQAQTAYRWVDNDGKVHYGDRPPPPQAAREVQERKYSAPAADRAPSSAMRLAQENFPVTLYVGAECPVCKEGRDYLKKRGIPFSEQLVASNEEIDALRAKLGGGEVMVPSLQVGAKTSKGFLAPAWSGLLDAAGYPKAP
jgi:glutaredoxin